jgi:26S proteasome regulatory subunit T6
MGVQATGEGLRAYYKGKIEDLEIQIRDKQHNLWRMEAQRNDLNLKGKNVSNF